MLNQDFLNKLNLVKSLLDAPSSKLNSQHVGLIAEIFGVEVQEGKLQEVATIINSDDEDTIALWASKPENLQIFNKMRNQQRVTEMIECPECSNMSVYGVNEIAIENPKVMCKHCDHVISL
jgi:DNA-directed RNA polymerase subunit RPC12/RpoP